MLRLILVRHAKSAWDDPTLSDFDRPLAPRGRRAARWIGEILREEGWLPEQVICSPAARTRETLALSGVDPAEVSFEQAVYDLRDDDYVDFIGAAGRRRCVMLIGHNMAISATGTALVDGGLDAFGTGAIAVVEFTEEDWGAVRPGTGRLIAFSKPPKE